MIQLSGYQVKEEIYQSKNTLVYRSFREKDNQPVIIKLLNQDYPSPDQIKQFQYEYEVVKDLDIEGVVKNFELLSYKNSLAIVMEDIDGVSLDRILEKNILDIKSFLNIAIKLTQIIGNIHKKEVIHKDIKPHNVIINLKNGSVKLIDFSISTQLKKENQGMLSPDSLEGTLAYISPEQTGRMNRSIDYRSDYYSFGVTLYEMITGKRPFQSTDPMELVHSHIAIQPKAPAEIDQRIPEMISKIIMKLLEKNAEDRYQSVQGILADFVNCFKQFKDNQKIEIFSIGQKDISAIFQIPEKLYGRDQEVTVLLDQFNKTLEGKREVLFVSGPPGIGKTALISEVHKPIVAEKGYYLFGKFDIYKKNIPYTALIQAFSSMGRQILAEHGEQINIWKSRILDAVGTLGQVIIDVIPVFEKIIGSQPAVQPLPAAEAQNRFNMTFLNFIKVFATKQHPLVLFLDDLQWADQASMFLLDRLQDDNDIKFLLLIGSYRENEIETGHFLNKLIKKMDEMETVDFKKVDINALKLEDIVSLVSESLYQEPNQVRGLAEMVLLKTGGNPFFITEFLKQIYEEKLLFFNKGWQWDLKAIENAKVTDNVVELMADKIQKLSMQTMNVIKMASCIGIKFYLDTLSIVYGQSEEETRKDLAEAINEGMLVALGNEVRFVHDRVREAAYSLLDDHEKEKNHYAIGKQFQKFFGDEELEDKIFTIVNQLNSAKQILTASEKEELIELNLKAGLKAKASAAFDAALTFFSHGMDLLSDNAWTKNYSVTFNIYGEKSESLYLTGNYREAETLYFIALENAKDLVDKTKIWGQMIIHYTVVNNHEKALMILHDSLKAFKIKIPKPRQTNMAHILPEVLQVKSRLKKVKIENILTLPLCEDKLSNCVMDLLSKSISTSYFYDSQLFTLISLKMVIISLKFGLSAYSTLALSSTAIVFIAMGDINTGHELGKIAVDLLSKYSWNFLSGKVHDLFGYFVNPWKIHVKECVKYLESGLENSIRYGDNEYAQLNINCMNVLNFHYGKNLSAMDEEITSLKNLMQKLKQETCTITSIVHQSVLNLLGKSDNVFEFSGEIFNETETLPILEKNKLQIEISNFYLKKILIYYLFEKYDEALQVIETQTMVSDYAIFVLPAFEFFQAIIYLAVYNKLPQSQQKKYFSIIKKIEKKYEGYKKFGACNFEPHLLFIKAELAKSNGHFEQVIDLYDAAIESAIRNDYNNIAAMANERAAKYYMGINKEKIAVIYLEESLYYYQKWGVVTKIDDIKNKYNNILQKANYNLSLKSDKTNSTSTTTKFLDIGTLMKSTQALSSEIDMKKLLESLIKIIIENAGAQKGILILKNDKGEFVIEAEGETGNDNIQIMQSIPINQSMNLSSNIVHYTINSMEHTVLSNAYQDGNFRNEAYVINNQIKSVLCSPIIKQGNLFGVIYLENNLLKGAFTDDRVEMLNMLSSQIAISIENSKLISNLTEQERLKREMEIAERIQTSLCPPAPEHDDFELAAVMKPAEEVGGDYYDIAFDNEKNLWIAIGDVSGHGVTPGLIMMMAQTSFNSYMQNSGAAAPKDLMTEVNRVLQQNIKVRLKESHFMTMMFIKYLGNGEFVQSGKHLDVVIYRADTKKCEMIPSDGLFLGIMPDIAHTLKNISFKLNKDDIMVLCTDGIIESRNKEGELLDFKGLMKIIEENADKELSEIRDVIIDQSLIWCDHLQDDDMTLVLAKRK